MTREFGAEREGAPGERGEGIGRDCMTGTNG